MTYQHGIDTNPELIRQGFKPTIAVHKQRDRYITKSAYAKMAKREKADYDLFEIATTNFAGTSASYYADVGGRREYFHIRKTS